MRTKLLGIVGVALVLLVGAVFSASAVPVGRDVPPNDAVVQFFVSHGIDAQYVGLRQDKVPADVWAKIVALDADPQLSALVQTNLRESLFAYGNTVYEQVGNVYYTASRLTSGMSPTFGWEMIG